MRSKFGCLARKAREPGVEDPNEGSHRDFRALLSKMMALANPHRRPGALDPGKPQL